MIQADLARRIRTAEARRKFLVGTISTELIDLKPAAVPELRAFLDAAILRETAGLDQAKKQTQRVFSLSLQRAAAKVG
jgi:hypothetical protein